MNIYKPTGEKVENWPQWVKRVSEQNTELLTTIADHEKKNAELTTEVEELKRRCCDVWRELMEEKAKQ